MEIQIDSPSRASSAAAAGGGGGGSSACIPSPGTLARHDSEGGGSTKKIRSYEDLVQLRVDSSQPPFFPPQAPGPSGAQASVLCYGENTEDVLRMKKLVLIMVGLPASGKSYISKKLCRYLRWLGFQAKCFNATDYRSTVLSKEEAHDVLEADTPSAKEKRQKLTEAALSDMIGWLTDEQGYVGILDCTNVTRERREWILQRCASLSDAQIVFIESICKDPAIHESNCALKIKNSSYKGLDPAEARRVLDQRLEWYRLIYEPIGEMEDGISYIQVHDIGKKLIINQCNGYLTSQVAACLNNMHPHKRNIWLTRHGQSEDNERGVLGGDSPLTEGGRGYAQRLAKWVRGQNAANLLVWTSCLRRTMQTADPLRKTMGVAIHPTPLLNEIAGGMCDSITEEALEHNHPDVFAARQRDKLAYRYPGGGESYLDVIERVKPLILELERLQVPVLVICHKAVLRTLLAYFTDMPLTEMTNHPVPLHTVIQLELTVYDCNTRHIELTTDTHLDQALAK